VHRAGCQDRQRETNTLALLLDDLLDVSQVSRGRIELRHQVVSVGSLIEAAVETARSALESRKLRLHIESSADDLVVNGDPLHLTHVLTNLLTNVAKYTDLGGDVWVRVFVETGSVAVRVRDSGIGLDSSAISSVFDMFTQLSAAAGARTKSGLGIELALSRGLVDLHVGTIEASEQRARERL
jgi:signal transduction histidine kinase